MIVAMYNINSSEIEGVVKLKALTDEAASKGYTVIGLTSSGNDAKQEVKQNYKLDFDFYLCDEKVIKTIIRSNPGIVILEKGTVVNKAHWNDIEGIELIQEESNIVVVDQPDNDILYLIDGKLSTKEELESLSNDEIVKVSFLKERNKGDVLDSINEANNTNYSSIVMFELKND